MPSNKETLFQDHICSFLHKEHRYIPLSNEDITDKDFHIIEKHLIQFITDTQDDKYKELEENYKTDTNREIIKALKTELHKTSLWLIIRKGLMVKEVKFELYKPKPRSTTGENQLENSEIQTWHNSFCRKFIYKCKICPWKFCFRIIEYLYYFLHVLIVYIITVKILFS
jgi:hypothetical protein